jgi:putative protein-disulfide isomerase
MSSLIYIADPMCSWCYGFGPELDALMTGLPGLPLNIVVGGLRAYNTKKADAAFKATLRQHWQQVAQRTGLPFNEAGMDADNFVYDTEPACRAVVTARLLAPQTTLTVFGAIQHAFYQEGLDVTDGRQLAALAAAVFKQAGVAFDADAFHAAWSSEQAIRETHEDFQQSKRWNVDGFPALVLERDGRLDLVTLGYMPLPQLVEQMQALVDRDSDKQPATV